MQKLKERTVWRVQSGGRSKWFTGELGAREWANDRFDTEVDGVPFLREVTLSEAIQILNQLEYLAAA
jgi:hypothetical protein